MALKRIVRAKKSITDLGTWSDTKMPKSAFPLGKQGGFRIRPPYRWRIVKFDIGEESFRLLIFYRLDLMKCSAMLGRCDEGDMCVLARYEFHADHPGWHFHTDCSGQWVPGRTGGLHDCIPNHGSRNRRTDFSVNGDDRAYYVVASAFRLLDRDLFGFQ